MWNFCETKAPFLVSANFPLVYVVHRLFFMNRVSLNLGHFQREYFVLTNCDFFSKHGIFIHLKTVLIIVVEDFSMKKNVIHKKPFISWIELRFRTRNECFFSIKFDFVLKLSDRTMSWSIQPEVNRNSIAEMKRAYNTTKCSTPRNLSFECYLPFDGFEKRKKHVFRNWNESKSQ